MLEFNKLERKIAERLGNFAVTPCVGVWIEIVSRRYRDLKHLSLPVWECGLKLLMQYRLSISKFVTPCVGVWIEILTACFTDTMFLSHSLCGSVD